MIFLAIAFLPLLAQLTAPPIHGPYVECFAGEKYDYCFDGDGYLVVHEKALGD